MQTASLFWALFAAVMGLVWLVVPFVIFGIKDLLRQLLAEQRRTNDILTHGARAPMPESPAPTAIPLARRYP